VIEFSYFPIAVPVTLTSANWAPAVWVGVMLLTVVIYAVYGKRHCIPPGVFVEGKRDGDFELQAVD
jgi:choline transport protein